MSGAAPDLALAARLATGGHRKPQDLARVFAAFFAAAERLEAVRFAALDFACFESALGEAAEWPSRWSALLVARERVLDTFFLPFSPAALSCLAFSRVAFEAVPFFGGASFTPARRAFDRPIAIACLAERAPCFPSRT